MTVRTSALAILLIAPPLLACKALSKGGEKSPPSVSAGVAPAPAEPASPPSMAGVYRGKVTRNDGKTGRVVGLVTSAGDARFVADGDVQEVGKLALNGLDVSGTLETFVRGQTREVLTLKGKLVPKTSLSGSFTAPSGGGTFELAFSKEHDKPGALSVLAGTWSAGGFRMTIDEAGAFSGRDGSPCQYSGTFRLADPVFDAFAFDLSVARCGKFDGSYRGHAALADGKLAYGVSGDRFARSGYLIKK